MTTYYIDATGGLDSNAGTSTASAWQTLGKVWTFSSTTTFSPGDKILLKRGETWTIASSGAYLLIQSMHGAAGNPIIVGAYGSGELPLINGNAVGTVCVYINACTYVTIQDLHCIKSVSGNFHLLAGTANSNNIIFRRCRSSLSGRDNFYAESTLSGFALDAIEYWDCVGTLPFRGNFFCFQFGRTPTVGVHYYRCFASYCGQGSASHNFSAYDSDQIHWNSCESCYAGIDPLTGAISTVSGSAGESIGFALDDFCSSCSMTYCYSHHNAVTGVQACHQGNNNLIAYNVVSHNQFGIIINGAPGGTTGMLIYNNAVCYNWGTSGGGIWGWAPMNVITIKNNICAFNYSYGALFDAATSLTFDHNLVYGNVGGSTFGCTPTNGVTTDPKFNTPYDLSIGAGSGAINAAANLGTTYQIALRKGTNWAPQDMMGRFDVHTGNQNSYGAGWDIGAYIYDAGDAMPDAAGVRVRETTTTTGTGTLTLAGAVGGHKAIATLGADGTTAKFMLEDANGTSWEYFRGTIGGSGSTLARTATLESTNGGSSISLTSGTHRIFNFDPGIVG